MTQDVHRKLSPGLLWQKEGFQQAKLDFNLRNRRLKCYIWSIVLYGTESWQFGM
jgi:hypothetical protein